VPSKSGSPSTDSPHAFVPGKSHPCARTEPVRRGVLPVQFDATAAGSRSVGCQAERCANPHDVRAPTPPAGLESRCNSPAVTGPTLSSDRPRAQPGPARAVRRCRRSRSQMMPRGGRSPTGRRPDRGAHRPGDVRKYSGVVGPNPSRPGHGNSTARQAGCCDRA